MRIIDKGKAFYLKLPWGLGVAGDGSVFVQNGYLYAVEHDEDWTFSIAKYEILD